MRRLTAILVPFVLALATSSAAYATVTHASSAVQVMHGSAVVSTWPSVNPSTGTALFPCASATSCATTVPINSRDFGRVIKWCDGNAFSFLVQNSVSRSVFCFGKPDWEIVVTGYLWDCSGSSCVPVIGPAGTFVSVDVQPSKAFG